MRDAVLGVSTSTSQRVNELTIYREWAGICLFIYSYFMISSTLLRLYTRFTWVTRVTLTYVIPVLIQYTKVIVFIPLVFRAVFEINENVAIKSLLAGPQMPRWKAANRLDTLEDVGESWIEVFWSSLVLIVWCAMPGCFFGDIPCIDKLEASCCSSASVFLYAWQFTGEIQV